MENEKWLEMAVRFSLGLCPLQKRPVFIETRGLADDQKWIVAMDIWVLSKSGFWYREPVPLKRTETFIKNTRFEDKEAALTAWQRFQSRGIKHILTDEKSIAENDSEQLQSANN